MAPALFYSFIKKTKTMLRLILLCAALAQILPAHAQSDSLQAARWVTEAESLLKNGKQEEALASHRKALAVFQKNNRLDQWLECHIPLAFVWADDLRDPFATQDFLAGALKQAWRQPANPREWEQLARIHLYKGYFYQWYTFDYKNAVRHYEESFGVFVQHLSEKNDRIAGYIYHQLGNVYTRLGDYTRAENMLRRGIEYGQKNNRPEIGKYGDLAIALTDLGRYDEALKVVREGLGVQGADKDALITARLSEARLLMNLGRVAQAKNALAQVPALITALGGAEDETAYYQAGYHAMAGAIDDSLGRTAPALDHYRQAINFEMTAQGTSFCREVGKARNSLASFYLRCRRPAEALREFQEVLKCVVKDFRPAGTDENPDAAQFSAENTIIEGLIGKAAAYGQLGQYEKALACFELIPHVEARLRATYAYESSSLRALDESRRRFDEAIALSWRLYESSNHDRRFAERAFLLSEKARGILLLHSLVRARADYALPEEVRLRENDLRVKTAWYDHEIAAEKDKGNAGDAARLRQLEKELLDLKQEQERFKTMLRDSFPDYARLSEEVSFLTAGEVRTLLRPDQALASFYLTETDAFIFFFDAAGMFNWRKAALPPDFREQVRRYADYLYRGDENDKNERAAFLQFAARLYDILLATELKTAPANLQSLLVVPDGILALVPFETLLQGAVASNWREQPWLLRRYNIGYAYSATLLATQQEISRRHAQEQSPRFALGGFAPSYPGEAGTTRDNPLPDYPLPDIKSTQVELERVHALTGGKAYPKEQATEQQFRAIAADCKTLLLAMHGFSNDEHPELSCLMFGIPNRDSSIANNVLYASELQIMQLHADLVVLSACHTGAGKLHRGEGVYSLARAFAAAGVPCTVMSLWRLHENPAPLLVEAFFKHLKAGKTKDEALRLAKLEFIDDDRNGEMLHPFYWAGLMATGDMCLLDLPRPTNGPAWALLVAGLAVSGFMLRRRMRRRQSLSFETI